MKRASCAAALGSLCLASAGLAQVQPGDIVAVGPDQVKIYDAAVQLKSTLISMPGADFTAVQVDVDGSDRIYVASRALQEVFVFSPAGELLHSFSTSISIHGRLYDIAPTGLAMTGVIDTYSDSGICVVGEGSYGVIVDRGGLFMAPLAEDTQALAAAVGCDWTTYFTSGDSQVRAIASVSSEWTFADLALRGETSLNGVTTVRGGAVYAAGDNAVYQLMPAGAVARSHDVAGTQSWGGVAVSLDAESIYAVDLSAAAGAPSLYKFGVAGGLQGSYTLGTLRDVKVVRAPYCPSICLVDLNGDGVVDFGDYLEFLNLFDALDPRVDFSGDGVIDFGDYLEFLNLFDAGC